MIIASSLSSIQKEKLIKVLKDHKIVIGWSFADIKRIIPSLCMYRILLENGAKPTQEFQRRLNTQIMEVVKKEILNLLDIGVIYLISDSKWTSLVQVMPKKFGVTIIMNEDNELVTTKV